MSDPDICEPLLMSLCGTQVSMPSALRPESDEQTERDNRTLGQTLHVFVAPAQDYWDELSPTVELWILFMTLPGRHRMS